MSGLWVLDSAVTDDLPRSWLVWHRETTDERSEVRAARHFRAYHSRESAHAAGAAVFALRLARGESVSVSVSPLGAPGPLEPCPPMDDCACAQWTLVALAALESQEREATVE